MASHESSPHTLAARTRLADLIAEAVGELSDRDPRFSSCPTGMG